MTKPIPHPLVDYPLILAGGMSLAGAGAMYRLFPRHFASLVALVIWGLIFLSLVLHMFTKTSPYWKSVGLRHAPGRVVANMTMLAILPANAMSILSVWAIATNWTTPHIAAIWMFSSLLINVYATLQLARYMRWF